MGLLEPLRRPAADDGEQGAVAPRRDNMAKLSILDLDLVRKRVFIRVDLNVPLKDGAITDDTRIRSSLETIQFDLAHGATALDGCNLGQTQGKHYRARQLHPT